MHQGQLVFAQLMRHLSLTTFRRCVARYAGEHKVKSFSCLPFTGDWRIYARFAARAESPSNHSRRSALVSGPTYFARAQSAATTSDARDGTHSVTMARVTQAAPTLAPPVPDSKRGQPPKCHRARCDNSPGAQRASPDARSTLGYDPG